MPDSQKPDLTAYIAMLKFEITVHTDKEIARLKSVEKDVKKTITDHCEDKRKWLKEHAAVYMEYITEQTDKEIARICEKTSFYNVCLNTSFTNLESQLKEITDSRKFIHLGARLKPIDEFGSIDPSAEKLEPKWINVAGREEHEAILKDPEKMVSLGLDPFYEIMVYLQRWGGWLEDENKNNS